VLELHLTMSNPHDIRNQESFDSAAAATSLRMTDQRLLLRLLLQIQALVMQFGIVGEAIHDHAFIQRGFRVRVF